MKRMQLLAGAALALTSVWAIAQEAPESLLPPGFDEPAPGRPAPSRPAPGRGAPAPAAAPSAPRAVPASPAASTSSPVVQPLPGPAGGDLADAPASFALKKLPTLDELEKMSPEELEESLGLKPKFDIPPAARRSMAQVGIIAEDEGGMRVGSLAGQDVSLVHAALAGNGGELVSRWGHILLRRALASRLDAPAGMDPADFIGLRAALLLRMGEAEAARALVQDVDTGNYTPLLRDAAFDAYVATADFTGICPAMATQGDTRKDPPWQAAQAICGAFRGDGANAMAQLGRSLSRGSMPRIDLLLAQKYAGAAGKERLAVTIEWDDVQDMTPWRYGMTIAVGLEPPETLMKGAPAGYDYTAATAPMLGLTRRAEAADRAAGAGILSSAALVDLYSQIYANEDVNDDWSQRATTLRDAYVATDPAARLAAMQQLWNTASSPLARYSRKVLTAYAAARLPVDTQFADNADQLIDSMLTAGLDRNAMGWSRIVEPGSMAWGLLAVAAPAAPAVNNAALDTFFGDDESVSQRKSAFLLAGLAGLGRISSEAEAEFSRRLEIDLRRQSKWTRMIDKAAQVDNATLVALLAAVGMQGDGWDKMTPRYLYHIVSALRQVGLEAEARMIAAEAVARG